MTFHRPQPPSPSPSDGLPSTGTLRITHPASTTPLLGTAVISARRTQGTLQELLVLVLELDRGPPERLEFCGELVFELWEAGYE